MNGIEFQEVDQQLDALAEQQENTELVRILQENQIHAGLLADFGFKSVMDLFQLVNETPITEKDLTELARGLSTSGVLPFAASDSSGGCYVAIRGDQKMRTKGGLTLAFELEESLIGLIPGLQRQDLHCVVIAAEEFQTLSVFVTDEERRATLLQEANVSEEARDHFYRVLADASGRGVSDIHIEPYGKEYRIRFREKGVLWVYDAELSRTDASSFVGVLRSDASAGIVSPHVPEDLSIRITDEQGKKYPTLKGCNLRISMVPTARDGAPRDVVLRLHSQEAKAAALQELGLGAKVTTEIRNLIRARRGIILVTGPTGSGKTSSLYAVLQEMMNDTLKFYTIEDPAEVIIDGLTQTKINDKHGGTFARMLRSGLRQDPDVMLIGEIRDGETAETAIRAAVTGHLVLSTLHTNDAVGAVTRLLDYPDVSPANLAEALRAVMAQRLIPRCCKRCSEVVNAREDMNNILGLDKSAQIDFDIKVYRRPAQANPDCPECKGSGIIGRKPIAELWILSRQERELIRRQKLDLDSDEVRRMALKRGMVPLWRSGLTAAMGGTVSFDDFISVIMPEELADNREDVLHALRRLNEKIETRKQS